MVFNGRRQACEWLLAEPTFAEVVDAQRYLSAVRSCVRRQAQGMPVIPETEAIALAPSPIAQLYLETVNQALENPVWLKGGLPRREWAPKVLSAVYSEPSCIRKLGDVNKKVAACAKELNQVPVSKVSE